jgi:hypothetical protein
MKRVFSALLLLIMAVAPAACGQKASTRSTPVSPAPAESGPLHPMHGVDTRLAHSPSALHCGSTRPVWVNTHTRVYHMPGDSYYGHTKFGGYICEQDAVRAGYRRAKK